MSSYNILCLFHPFLCIRGGGNGWMALISSHVLPPRILRRARLSRPHPFGKGRGGWGCILASEGAEAVLKEPTSLNRGEGLVAGLTGEVGGVEGEGEGEGGGEVVVEEGENEQISTVMGLMSVSNSAPPHR
jgi:hypothetical protein